MNEIQYQTTYSILQKEVERLRAIEAAAKLAYDEWGATVPCPDNKCAMCLLGAALEVKG